MKIRFKYAWLVALLLSFGIVKAQEKPNIILICADDLGWSDIGCYGSEVQTPNLDKLADEGIRFRHFHNTSKCFPSRSCLLTGIYAQQNGYAKNFKQPLTNSVTLGEVLKMAGYRTLWSGKHHGLENPVIRGFDRYYGLKDGACNYFNPGNQRPGEGAPARKGAPGKKTVRSWCIDSVMYEPYPPEAKDFYTTDYFTKTAVDWLEQYKNEKQLKSGLLNKSFKLSEPTYQNWETLDDSIRRDEIRKMEVYAAMIDRLDQNIGRILAKLREIGEEKNTLILFMSDNGASAEMVNITDDYGEIGTMTRWASLGKDWANVGNTPFRFFKNFSYEGGINTPLIAWWPSKIKANTFSDFSGHFIDIMATLVDLTGARYPNQFNNQQITPMQGQTLLPAFYGENPAREKPIYWEWQDGQAVYFNSWKIVKEGLDNPWDLYNIEEDPTETKNLARQYPAKVKELGQLFSEWKSGLPEASK